MASFCLVLMQLVVTAVAAQRAFLLGVLMCSQLKCILLKVHIEIISIRCDGAAIYKTWNLECLNISFSVKQKRVFIVDVTLKLLKDET